jgi:hypothetical protein
MSLQTRILHILVALDTFLFVAATLGSAYPGETASGAAWRLELQGRWQGRVFRPFIDGLFRWLERDHCQSAYAYERNLSARLPPDAPGA